MTTPKFFVIPPKLLRLKIIRLLILFSALISFFHFSAAQTNISGVVNSYYRVIEVIPAKACVRLNTTTGLGFNDRAMIIQMKGAAINTSSSSSFGDTTSLNQAGNYETGTICYIKGDSVFFVFMFLYQYSTADKVQLVRIPEYYSATVTDTLKAAPWNNSTGTGGVLAIYVQEDLVLNAPVSGDSSGYRGGAYRISGSSCSNSPGAIAYVYNGSSSPTQNGAYKGEGVADVAASQSGGRGAPANGGGGGNNHNNGGGGGANLSTGGDGGGNSSSSGCTLSIQGKGGKALSSYGGRKIFMGGGGGAGHANNGYVGSNGGGHGGGIIFIRANNLAGNNHKISANGQQGGPAASDGASGAGAGGTIIMNVASYIGTTTIEAKGGQGGTENDNGNINYCYGGGGGGSGGVIYFSGATPAIPFTAAGGNAGPEIGGDASCNAAVPSLAGLAGQVIVNYTYSSSLVLSNSYCSVLLPIELISFTAHYTSGQTILTWKIAQPGSIDHFIIERAVGSNDWIAIHDEAAKETLLNYHYTDLSPQHGYNLYRIKIIKKTAAVAYSVVQKVFVPGKNEMITIYPNPASNKILISGITSSPQLSLLDLSGRILWQKKIIAYYPHTEVNLPSLPAGVYVIKINEIVKRLVIQ
jgi:hypothetical protein